MTTKDDQWAALNRESALIAQQLGSGASAFNKAGYASIGYYYQAFFGFSIALERIAKLVLAFDCAASDSGSFPDSRTFRKFGHDLQKLETRVESIAAELEIEDCFDTRGHRVDEIERRILGELGGFANNLTRYYNLEVLSDGSGTTGDPVASWHLGVTQLVISEHLPPRSAARILFDAKTAQELLSPIGMFHLFTETGDLIDDPYEMVKFARMGAFARRWERMYVLRIARRWLLVMLEAAGRATRSGVSVPMLSEHFTSFLQPDSYLRDRSTF